MSEPLSKQERIDLFAVPPRGRRESSQYWVRRYEATVQHLEHVCDSKSDTKAAYRDKIMEQAREIGHLRADLAIMKARAEAAEGEVTRLRAHLRDATPDDLRAAGLTVAVHNDYRIGGERFTFWLFVRESDGMSFKGEGYHDTEALSRIRVALAATLDDTEQG